MRHRIAVVNRNTELIVVHVSPALKRELVARAEAADLKLGPYVRALVKSKIKEDLDARQ